MVLVILGLDGYNFHKQSLSNLPPSWNIQDGKVHKGEHVHEHEHEHEHELLLLWQGRAHDGEWVRLHRVRGRGRRSGGTARRSRSRQGAWSQVKVNTISFLVSHTRTKIGKTQIPCGGGGPGPRRPWVARTPWGKRCFFRMYCDENCEFPFATNWVPILPSSILFA